jgi:DNA helicase HerA-like ATPase
VGMMVNKEKMLEDIFHESRTNIILGLKGSGKTNFCVVLMKELVELGFEIWTNVHFFNIEEVGIACERKKLPKGIYYRKKPDEIHTISKLSELLYGLLIPGKKAVFIDEAGIVLPSGTSRDTKTMKQLAYIIRHFDCAFVLITQVAGSVPPDLRENLVDYRLTIKRQGKYRELEIGARSVEADIDGKEYIDFPTVEILTDIPPATLPYDGDFPSTFKIDIDLKITLDEFGELKSSLDLEKKGKEILDRLTRADDTLGEKLRAYKKKHPKITGQELARIFKCSNGNVTYHLNKK